MSNSFINEGDLQENIGRNLILKAFDNDLEKGGKPAILGEKRIFGGREYIKTSEGWKFHGKGTGVKAQQHVAQHAPKNEPAPQFRKKETKKEEKKNSLTKDEQKIKNILSVGDNSFHSELQVLDLLGFRKQPKIIDQKDYLKIKGKEIFTGLNAGIALDEGTQKEADEVVDNYLKQFKEGDYHGSTSTVYSSDFGMNFTVDKSIAEEYAFGGSDEDYHKGKILSVKVLSEHYKICDRETAKLLSDKMSDKFGIKISLTIAAALSGYNFCTEEKDDDHIIPINRSVLICKNG